MITKFKLYEEINQNEPEEGDYVICSEYEKDIKDFIENNVGQYVHYEVGARYPYDIEYNIPDNIIKIYFENNCRRFSFDEIKYWSKDKDELESFLAAKKYNL